MCGKFRLAFLAALLCCSCAAYRIAPKCGGGDHMLTCQEFTALYGESSYPGLSARYGCAHTLFEDPRDLSRELVLLIGLADPRQIHT